MDSRFFHFGTTDEYLELLTEDKALMEILSVNLLSESAGMPFKYVPDEHTNTIHADTSVPENVVGLMGAATSHKGVAAVPCVMLSLLHAGVSLGERSIVEYSTLRECVAVGRNCIVSHCSVGQNVSIPANTFVHTISINVNKAESPFSLGYCTVVFGINDKLKASAQASQLQYMGKSVPDVFSDYERLAPDSGCVKLWEAKLFRVFRTAEESFADAYQVLEKLGYEGTPKNTLGDFPRLSMADILRMKNVDAMLQYRQKMQNAIDKMKYEQSFLPRLQMFANNAYASNIA